MGIGIRLKLFLGFFTLILLFIVSELLDFSRTRSPQRAEVYISDLVSFVLKRHAPHKEIKVSTEVAAKLPSLFVDSRQLGQVLDNIVLNAYLSMFEGGRMEIKAKSVKDKIHLSVSDTGCGIPDEDMKKLFEPLFTTKAWGIGLGLSVTRNLLEANGGKIEVESKEGVGSTFTLILPAKGSNR